METTYHRVWHVMHALIGQTCAYSDMCTLCTREISKAGPATCIAMASEGEAVCTMYVGTCGTRPLHLHGNVDSKCGRDTKK